MPALSTIPQIEPLTHDQQQRPQFMDGSWITWLYEIWARLGLASYRLGNVLELANQHASIVATALPLPALTAGRYRVSWYARVTAVDPISSSLGVTLGWQESGQSLTVTATPVTGNLTTSLQSVSAWLEVDGNSPITYSTTYASNTPGAMQYRLSIQVEQVS